MAKVMAIRHKKAGKCRLFGFQGFLTAGGAPVARAAESS